MPYERPKTPLLDKLRAAKQQAGAARLVDIEAEIRARLASRGNSVGINPDGSISPHTREQIVRMQMEAFERGQILALVLEHPDGQLMVQVLGPPTLQLAEVLEQAATGYRQALAAPAAGDPPPS